MPKANRATSPNQTAWAQERQTGCFAVQLHDYLQESPADTARISRFLHALRTDNFSDSARRRRLRAFMRTKLPLCTARVHWLRYVFFYAIGVNIPFWFASRTLGLLLHGWFCMEYALLGVIALFLPGVVVSVLLGFEILLDLLCAVCQTYYLAPAEVFKNAGLFEDFTSTRVVYIAVTGVLIISIAVFARSLSISTADIRDRVKAAVCLLLFIASCVFVEFAVAADGTGQKPNLFRGFDAADTVNIAHYSATRPARLPLRWLVHSEVFQVMLQKEESSLPSHIAAIPSASAVGTMSAGIRPNSNGQMPNLVLIVVESWGLATDPSIGNSLIEPYNRADLIAKYKVLKGAVPFYGATIVGEARELCGTMVGLHIIEASQNELARCLPDRLAAMGYQNIALHGMDGRWFDRRTWYPRIGFQEEWFRDQFRAQNLPSCEGSFLGTCDTAIADWIGDRLKVPEDHPKFIYWMTLNSHLPVPNPPPLLSPVSCAFSPSLTQQPALCAWFQLVANVHEAVYTQAMRFQARPTVFVVVGDHAPPFSDAGLRNDFSHTVVPYIVLVPAKTATALEAKRPPERRPGAKSETSSLQ